MPIISLEPHALTLTIDFGSLTFVDTSILTEQSFNWIGQERAKQATYFGLQTNHPDYNLFVLGETGSGRSSLLQQAMTEVAANKPTPPDLCYVYNFHAPQQPLALQLPAGKGNWLQQQLTKFIHDLLQAIPKQLNRDNDFKTKTGLVENNLKEVSLLEQDQNEKLITLYQNWIDPTLSQILNNLSDGLTPTFPDYAKLENYLGNLKRDILNHLNIFQSADIQERKNQATLTTLCERYQINVVVDNQALTGAPVIIENNPSLQSLFGNIGCQMISGGMLITNFTHIQAGSLLKAQGGFLMLYLDDLLADTHAWEKFCRMLRSHMIQIEEVRSTHTTTPVISLEPEPVKTHIKIILIGSREQYYAIQQENPELARRFLVKVDFSASFLASIPAYQSLTVFIAHLCQQLCLPHFSHAAVAHVLKLCHRVAEDQKRLTTNFSYIEMLVVESAHQCQTRNGTIVSEKDIKNARQMQVQRHNYPEQFTQETIADGDIVITVHGKKTGQINGLSLIEMGDYSFGVPARITAHTFAGEDGLLNIEREVGMSGPVHDKGVFILQNFLSALFHHNAPLALNASIVFEQEYYGIEGDSASCAELYALLSALSGLPFRQGIAVTGAINQFGEMLPVGGINEKIEGFFKVCETAGLDGTQGVIIPDCNRRNLLLDDKVIHAVAKGWFQIYTIHHMYDGLELLSGLPAGISDDTEFREIVNYPRDTVLGYAQKTLRAYRAACQQPSLPAKISSKQLVGR